ncbi:hypothetical protein, partial [Bacillus sp. LR_5]|uniref:hypothetical protein n=1 Tax=Bacillus sp. LR_5 TaxID=3055784 RepID=UPI0036589340
LDESYYYFNLLNYYSICSLVSDIFSKITKRESGRGICQKKNDDSNHRFFYLLSYSLKNTSLGQTVIT